MEDKLAGRSRSTTGSVMLRYLGRRTLAVGSSVVPGTLVSSSGISVKSLMRTRADTKSQNSMIARSFHQQNVMRPRSIHPSPHLPAPRRGDEVTHYSAAQAHGRKWALGMVVQVTQCNECCVGGRLRGCVHEE